MAHNPTLAPISRGRAQFKLVTENTTSMVGMVFMYVSLCVCVVDMKF